MENVGRGGERYYQALTGIPSPVHFPSWQPDTFGHQMDIVDPSTRSRMMASIRGHDTKPERMVRSFLHRAGLRFRKHSRHLPGRPDIVLPKYRAVVFVHGCFWHRHHGCALAATPSTRPEFWQAKFDANTARDATAMARLSAMGWISHVVWECEVSSPEALDQLFWNVLGKFYQHR